MKHWLQLVAIPSAPSSSSNSDIQTLKKRIDDLEKARSRSPRRNVNKQYAITGGPAVLALPPSAPAQGAKGGKGGNHKKKGKGKGKSTSSSSAPSVTKDFAYLTKLPAKFRNNVHEKFHRWELCFDFQKGTCKNAASCKFVHICVGCRGPMPYDECKCHTHKTSLNRFVVNY